MRHFFKAAAVVALSAGLVGCSSLNPFSDGGKAERDAAEKAQRVPLIALDAELKADPNFAVITIYLPEASSADEWAQSGGSAGKVIGNRKGADAFEIAWKKNVGEGSSRKQRLIAPPIVSNDRIYVLDADQKVHALDLKGSKVWSRALEKPRKLDKIGIGGGLAVSGDKLVVTSGYGYAVALSTADGTELWKREAQAPITGAPTISGGTIFTTSANNELYVLDLETGEARWSDQAIAESARVLSAPSPAVSDDIVVAPFSSGEIIAYLPVNGRRLWSDSLTRGGQFTPISAINDIAGRPVISEGMVYAASQSGVVVGVDAISGGRVWAKPFGSIQSPAVAGQFVFILNTNAQLVCMDKSTGGVIWVRQLRQFEKEKKGKGRIVWTGPVIASDRLVVANSRGEVMALDPQNGETLDTVKVGDPVYIEPIVAHEHVYVLTDDARLVAIR